MSENDLVDDSFISADFDDEDLLDVHCYNWEKKIIAERDALKLEVAKLKEDAACQPDCLEGACLAWKARAVVAEDRVAHLEANYDKFAKAMDRGEAAYKSQALRFECAAAVLREELQRLCSVLEAVPALHRERDHTLAVLASSAGELALRVVNAAKKVGSFKRRPKEVADWPGGPGGWLREASDARKQLEDALVALDEAFLA